MSKARFPWILAGVLIVSWAGWHALGLVLAVAVLAVLYLSSVRLSPRIRHARCDGTGQHQGVLFTWVHRRCGGCQGGRAVRWGAARFGTPEIKAEAARNRAALDAAKAGQPVEVTVILIPDAAAHLEAVRQRSGLTVTDIINRAITLYEFADGQLGDGSQILVQRADGTLRAVRLL